MRQDMPKTRVTSEIRMVFSRAAATAALALVLPAVAMAQVAERSAADSLSKNRETKLQHDSLAVHFLRAPKAKPAARSVDGAGAAPSAKFRGRPEPVSAPELPNTPLPTRKLKSKR